MRAPMQSHLDHYRLSKAQFLRFETALGLVAWRREPSRACAMPLAHDRGALLN